MKGLISILCTEQNTLTLLAVKEQVSNIINSDSFNNTQQQVQQFLNCTTHQESIENKNRSNPSNKQKQPSHFNIYCTSVNDKGKDSEKRPKE